MRVLGIVASPRRMGMPVRGRAVVHAALPGEALLSGAATASVAALAAAAETKAAGRLFQGTRMRTV